MTDTTVAEQTALASAEAAKRVETVSPERQTDEICSVANNILFRKSDEVNRELRQLGEQAVNAPRSKKEIASLRWFTETPPQNFQSKEKPNGFAYEGTLIVTNKNGEPRQVKNIQRIEQRSDKTNTKDVFFCVVESEDGKVEEVVEVTRTQMVDAELVSQAELILENYSGVERKIVEAYQRLKQGDNSPVTANAEETNAMIREVAESAHMLSVEDIRSLIKSAPISPDQDDMRDEALSLLEGKNIMDSETTLQVLDKLGVNADSVAADTKKIKDEIHALKQKVKDNPQDEDAKQALASSELKLKLLQAAEKALGEDGELKKLFDLQEQGRLDSKQAEALTQAVREGKVDQVVAMIAPELKADPEKDSPEVAAEKEKKRAELGKIALQSGIGIFTLLAIISSSLFVAGKQAVGDIVSGR